MDYKSHPLEMLEEIMKLTLQRVNETFKPGFSFNRFIAQFLHLLALQQEDYTQLI